MSFDEVLAQLPSAEVRLGWTPEIDDLVWVCDAIVREWVPGRAAVPPSWLKAVHTTPAGSRVGGHMVFVQTANNPFGYYEALHFLRPRKALE